MNRDIAILDFGSQYTHLIARRIRELGVVSHIYPIHTPAASLAHSAGIILSGGPKSTIADDALSCDQGIFSLGTPILGLCYGHQLLAKHFGGIVTKGESREYGVATLSPTPSPLFQSLPATSTVWMSHGDYVSVLPPGFKQIASTGNDSIAAMAAEEKKIYGLQFHPEVAHTTHGQQILSHFIFDICSAKKNWTNLSMLEELQKQILREAENKKIFLLMSGGVDSTVCFALLEKTLGKERVYGCHIDHGFMRQGERIAVATALKNIGLDNLHIHDASDAFFAALDGVVEPEQKRIIIGNLFLDTTNEIMKKIGCVEGEWLLGQGTIYPDTIESGGTKHADKIKTHHNRVDRIQEMIVKGQIIEPIKELYKDEVRDVGRILGLPNELVDRHPFPGPGLAIRCLCSSGSDEIPERLEISIPELDSTDSLFRLPMKSVGVQGDERSYAHPAVLLSKKIDWPRLHALSPKITNANKTVNRVLLLLSPNHDRLSHSRVRPATLTRERIQRLREIDATVNTIIHTDERCRHIWQMPIVMVPFGYKTGESIVLRPVETNEAMTVKFAEIPPDLLDRIVQQIQALNMVDFIFFDITNKPPGTIEWE